MKNKEKIIDKILDEIEETTKEILNSNPIIDFISTPFTQEVNIDGKIYYMQY